MDSLVVGRTVRHRRRHLGLTLDQLADRSGISASRLSMLENGRREPKVSQLEAVAEALGLRLADLLEAEPPDRRSALEIELANSQATNLFRDLALPTVPSSRALPLDVLESLVGLHRELRRRAALAIATPEEARRANTELRLSMRERDNFLPDIEAAAAELVAIATRDGGRTGARGALTHHEVGLMAERLGFTIIHVADLPHSTRTVTDLENMRIYLPPASIPGGHGLRALALQAMGHRVLEHRKPTDYADFLRQRLEINYFSSACLMPLEPALGFLSEAKQRRDIAVEDFRDAFGVTHEAAAMRMSNLATRHLGLPMHFLRVTDDGAVAKVYENDDLPLPVDVSGSIEGQIVPRAWAARGAFEQANRTTAFHQMTDTQAGTYWCSTQTGTSATEEFSITVGVKFVDSKWFRGRDTHRRADTSSPAAQSDRHDTELAARWAGRGWPSARLHAHILSPLPSGTFPGVDDAEMYRFLEAHAALEDAPGA